MRAFLPTPRQTNWLILLGFGSFVAAIYVRQNILAFEPLIAACSASTPLAACGVRRIVLELSELQLFGGVALVAAVLHFMRPRVIMFSVALCAAAVGLLWGNPSLSALAIALLILAFARPPSDKRAPAPPTPPPATTPASSRTIH